MKNLFKGMLSLTALAVAATILPIITLAADPPPDYSAPRQLYFNNFDEAEVDDYLANNTLNNAQLEHINGSLKMTRTHDTSGSVQFTIPSTEIETATANKIMFEFDVSYAWDSGSCYVRPYINGKEFKELKQKELTGVYYIVYDRGAATATLYHPHAEPETIETIPEYPSGVSAGDLTLAVRNVFTAKASDSGKESQYAAYDYVAIYELPGDFSFNLENIRINGATLTTTHPLSSGIKTSDSTMFTIDDQEVHIIKQSNTYNTYNMTFSQALDYDTSYTLSAAVNLIGESISKEYDLSFVTEAYTMLEYTKPTELYFNNFDHPELDAYWEGNTINNAHLEHANGKLKMTRTSDSAGSVQFTIPRTEIKSTTANKIMFEFDVSYAWGNGSSYVRPYINGKEFEEKKLAELAGVYYILYDRITSTAVLYRPNSEVETITEVPAYPSGGSSGDITLAVRSLLTAKASVEGNESQYIAFDYIAIYELPDEFSFCVEQATANTALVKTTRPIHTSVWEETSGFSANCTNANVAKMPNTYNAYCVEFGETLDVGNAAELFGENVKFIDETVQLPGLHSVNFTPQEDYTVISLSLVQNGETIEVFDNTSDIGAELTASNISLINTHEISIIIACYQNIDENLVLVNAKLSDVTLPANVDDYVLNAIGLDLAGVDTSDLVVKAFAWTNSGNIIPLIEYDMAIGSDAS